MACADDAWDAGGNRVEYAVEALVCRSEVLEQLERYDAVVIARDQLIARAGDDLDPQVRYRVAASLFTRGRALASLGRRGDAVESYRELMRRFRVGEQARIDELLVWARKQIPRQGGWLNRFSR